MFVPPAAADGEEPANDAGGDEAGGDEAGADAPVAGPLVAVALCVGLGVAAGAAAFPSFRPRITKMPRATSPMTTTTNSSRCLPGESSMTGSATGADGGTGTRTAVRAAASTASGPA